MGNETLNYRSTITNEGDRLRIEIPAKPQWSQIKHLVLWLCGWAVGEVIALGFLVHGLTQGTLLNFSSLPIILILVVWLMVWGAIGAFVFQKLLKLIKIKEILAIDQSTLTLQRLYLSTQNSQIFNLSEVQNLHASPLAIMFDYKEQTYAFGLNLDIAEASYIVNLIQQRFPSQDHLSSNRLEDW